MTQRGGNTKFRAWCYTINNFSDSDTEHIQIMNEEAQYWIYGREVGENGTPHYQGYVYFSNARSFSSIKKKLPGAHIEPAKADRDANYFYCSKEGDFKANYSPYRCVVIKDLKGWQKEVEEIVISPPVDRKIYWFWEEIGGIGKTALIKYLLVKYPYCTFSRATKSADIVMVADRKYTCYLFDFARTQEGFAPYNAIEQLKDGLVTDAKLKKESRNVIMNEPTVICFANWPPDTTSLSADRWVIKYLR